MYDVMIRSRLKTLIAERNLERIKAGEDELTIRGIAEATGLSTSIISGLTSNRVRRVDYGTLDKLCNFFQCRIDGILEHIPEQEVHTDA